jgi:hypothetical protein
MFLAKKDQRRRDCHLHPQQTNRPRRSLGNGGKDSSGKKTSHGCLPSLCSGSGQLLGGQQVQKVCRVRGIWPHHHRVWCWCKFLYGDQRPERKRKRKRKGIRTVSDTFLRLFHRLTSLGQSMFLDHLTYVSPVWYLVKESKRHSRLPSLLPLAQSFLRSCHLPRAQ